MSLHMPEITPAHRRGASVLASVCAGLSPGEKALVLADDSSLAAAKVVSATAEELGGKVRLETIPMLKMHGQSPPAHIGPLMLEADVVFCLTAMSLAHTPERLSASEKGVRFLSLPDYSLDLLASESLNVDFSTLKPITDMLANRLSQAREIRVTTTAGTDILLYVEGRRANSCPGICTEPGCLASPPDAEANIAPLEEESEGLVVIDGSVPCPRIGVLSEPLRLHISRGRLVALEGPASPKAVIEEMMAQAGPRSG